MFPQRHEDAEVSFVENEVKALRETCLYQQERMRALEANVMAQLRVVALTMAVQVGHESGVPRSADEVLDTARLFLQFLN